MFHLTKQIFQRVFLMIRSESYHYLERKDPKTQVKSKECFKGGGFGNQLQSSSQTKQMIFFGKGVALSYSPLTPINWLCMKIDRAKEEILCFVYADDFKQPLLHFHLKVAPQALGLVLKRKLLTRKITSSVGVQRAHCPVLAKVANLRTSKNNSKVYSKMR